MKKILKSFLALILCLIIPTLTFADGGVAPRPDYYVWETYQKAVIIEEGQVETLILSTTFEGDPKDFGWVIPVPGKPEVDKSSNLLFASLANYTKEKEKRGIQPILEMAPSQKALQGISIIETKQVDIYDISVLSSDDPDSLAKWLREAGYQFPENSFYLLDEYIKNAWYFVVAKINPEGMTVDTETRLAKGQATPLKIKFKTEKLVYPLKISSITKPPPKQNSNTSGENAPIRHKAFKPSTDKVGILIYIFADSKKQIPSFQNIWADWVTKENIENLATDTEGNPWFSPTSKKMFLTKTVRNMEPSEMTEDLYIHKAPDNSRVGATTQSVGTKILLGFLYFFLVLLLLIITPLGLVFIICTLIQFLAKAKIPHIICWVLQILIFLISLCFLVVYTLIEIENSLRHNLATFLPVFIAFLVFLGGQILVLIWQVRHRIKQAQKITKIGENIFRKGEPKEESKSSQPRRKRLDIDLRM